MVSALNPISKDALMSAADLKRQLPAVGKDQQPQDIRGDLAGLA